MNDIRTVLDKEKPERGEESVPSAITMWQFSNTADVLKESEEDECVKSEAT